MAICSPYAGPALIERSEKNDQGGLLADMFRAAQDRAGTILTRENFDPRWMKQFQRQMRRIGEMSPYNWDELTAYYQKKGWLGKLDEKLTEELGYEVYKQTDSNNAKALMTPDAEGMAAAVTKTYLESVGNGFREMASNFLRKVNAGEDATEEGLLLARQMQGASRFGGYVLGWDQQMGRALRTQGLRNKAGQFDSFSGEFGNTEGWELVADEDTFQKIARLMQEGGDGQRQAIEQMMVLAKRVKFADNPIQAMRIGSTVEMTGSAWNEVWINGLLSGPATAVTNLVGSAWSMIRPMSQYLSGAVWSAMGSDDGTLAMVQASQALAAQTQSLNDAWKLAWQAAKSETSIYKPLTGATEIARGRAISGNTTRALAAKYGKESLLTEDTLNMIDQVGGFVRIPSRLMMGTDEFAKHIAIRGEVASRGVKKAYEQLGVEGLKDKARLKTFIEDQYAAAFRPDAPNARDRWAVDASYEYAMEVRKVANEVTFQEQNGIADVVTGITQKAPILKPFVPFVRTPLNILKQGFIESTGLGALVKAGQITFNEPSKAIINITEELLKDPAETARISGQIGLMSILGATVYGLTMNGTIVGGGPGRFRPGGRASDEQRAWEKMITASGRTPYSIQTPFGSIPWDRLGEPISMPLRMIADVASVSGYISEEEKDEMMMFVGTVMVQGLFNGSFLKGVDDLSNALFNDDEEGKGKARAVQNYVSTQTPFGSLLNYVDKINDPYRKAYAGASFADVWKVHEDTWTNGIMARVTDRIPGFSEKQPTMIDQVSAKPVPIYPGAGPMGLNPLQLAIPFMPRGEESADKTWQQIYEINGRYREWRPNMDVTNAEQQAINKLMGTIRIGGQTYSQAINQFYNRADVREYIKSKNAALSGQRTGIESEFSKLRTMYGKAAEAQYMNSNPAYYRRYTLNQQIKRKARNNDFSFRQDQSELDRLLSLVP